MESEFGRTFMSLLSLIANSSIYGVSVCQGTIHFDTKIIGLPPPLEYCTDPTTILMNEKNAP